jgi:hypothetical protein
VLLLPEAGLIYDNLVVALGRYVGIGPLLTALSWPRFWGHWVFGGWLIIASGSVLRHAGLTTARGPLGMAAFCLLTSLLMLLDLPHFWTSSLHPVCELGLVRDSLSVSPDKFCLPGQQAVPATFPRTAAVTCFTVILCGALLALRRGFPWMLLGGLLMLAVSLPAAKPLKLDNLGEVLIMGGLIWALARFAAQAPRPEVQA